MVTKPGYFSNELSNCTLGFSRCAKNGLNLGMPKNRIQINNEHQKLHTLYGMAFDKAFFIDQKEQTKKDCLNTSPARMALT